MLISRDAALIKEEWAGGLEDKWVVCTLVGFVGNVLMKPGPTGGDGRGGGELGTVGERAGILV